MRISQKVGVVCIMAGAALLLAAGAAAGKAAKVRICHFTAQGARILEVSENALTAHLEHGDVPAPATVETAAACLSPQPPPGEVAASATTDEQGVARFIVPETNIIAEVTVSDEGGAPLSPVEVALWAVGADFLIVAADEDLRYAPAYEEGSLLDARPGSAPKLARKLVMQAFTSTLPGVGLLRSGNVSFPSFVRSHFSPSVECFTRDELESFLEGACGSAFSVLSGAVVGHFQVVGWVTVAGQQTVDVLLGETLSSLFCPSLAAQSANLTFSGKSLPLELRIYNPPLLPGVKIFPIFLEEMGSCGGGCCVAQGTQCALASSQSRCTAVGGAFKPGVPCTPNPCPRGACCDPGGVCSVLTPEDCSAQGGTYQGDGSGCSPDPCPKPLRFTMESSRATGGTSVVLPVTGGTIKALITVPGNMIRGSGTTGDCGRGDVRVEMRVCPPDEGCTGFTVYAGQGHGLNICHEHDEVLGPFNLRSSKKPGTSLSFNAITEKLAVAEVEILP